MFSMFLDLCKNLMDYIRIIWISRDGPDIKPRRDQELEVVRHFNAVTDVYESTTSRWLTVDDR